MTAFSVASITLGAVRAVALGHFRRWADVDDTVALDDDVPPKMDSSASFMVTTVPFLMKIRSVTLHNLLHPMVPHHSRVNTLPDCGDPADCDGSTQIDFDWR